MINLRTFFKIHFDTPEISDANFYKFVEDHLSRLKANNDNGTYNTMYADTLAAFDSYAAAVSKEDVQYTQQQGSTIGVDTIIAEFKENVSRSEGLINYTYGIKSPEYQEFFPMGVTEYSQANKANIEVLMMRMASKTQKYSLQLGTDIATRFANYRSNYINARRTQLENIGRVSADKTQTEVTRAILERQTMSNLLLIANEFLGNPERGLDFFDQSIVRRNINTTDEGETVTNTIDPKISKTILRGFDSGVGFVLSNIGTTVLRFCIADNEDEACSSNGITVSAGDTITATVFELNANSGEKLNVTNLDNDKIGKYEVERLA